MNLALVFVLWSHAPSPAQLQSPTRSPTQSPTQSPTHSPTQSPTHSPARDAPVPRAARDPWFGRDKLLHFAASAVIQGAAHSMLRANGRDYGTASRGAALVTLTAGVGKELWDRHRGRDASLRDLAWDGIGGVTGAVAMRQAGR